MLHIPYSKILATVIIALSSFSIEAAPADSIGASDRLRSRITLDLGGAYVMPSCQIARGENAFEKKVRGAYAADIQYSFMMPRGSKSDKLYPHTYQGVGIGMTGFASNDVTGTPFNLYVLQGSRIASLSSALTLDYEWNFGASFGWKKITGDNPFDKYDVDGFGSHTNAYINLCFLLRYRLSDHFTLSGGIGISHFSNGNTNYPNPGINTLWGRVGLTYFLDGNLPDSPCDWSGFEPGFIFDVTLYGAWRKSTFDTGMDYNDADEILVAPGHFGVGGFNFNPMYRFNPVFSAGLSLDGQYDVGANLSKNYVMTSPSDDPKFYRTSFADRSTLGISARAELTMPIFSVNVGIGHSLWAPGGPDLRGWYQTFTLKTFVTPRLYLSTGYRLIRFHNPGNLMLGVGYSFGR